MPAKLPVSLVVITFNEEANIERCLRAADFCAETIIVDSGSTDRTVELARAFGAIVHTRPWPGYGPQKNFGCDQAGQPWILCIDADEVVTPELRESISVAFSGEIVHDGFDINRHGIYAGQEINHSGWYPQWRTFLYRKGTAEWGGMEPHVTVQFRGKSKQKLRGDLLHYTYRSIDEHLRKNISSARAAAHAMQARGVSVSALDLTLRPAWAWFRCYVMQLGFLDGFRGLVIANGQMTYTFLKYAYLRELQTTKPEQKAT